MWRVYPNAPKYAAQVRRGGRITDATGSSVASAKSCRDTGERQAKCARLATGPATRTGKRSLRPPGVPQSSQDRRGGQKERPRRVKPAGSFGLPSVLLIYPNFSLCLFELARRHPAINLSATFLYPPSLSMCPPPVPSLPISGSRASISSAIFLQSDAFM